MGLWDSLLNWLRSYSKRRLGIELGFLSRFEKGKILPSISGIEGKDIPLTFCLFFKQEMELSLVGLQNAGKTSLVNGIATGGYSEDRIPTVGFNMRKVTKGNVTIKLWDLGGQRRFRGMWERYCRGVSAIVLVIALHLRLLFLACFYRIRVPLISLIHANALMDQNSYLFPLKPLKYVVDAADRDSVPISRTELHELLTKPSLSGIPLLVLGNKIDKSEALSKQALVDQLGLDSIQEREVCCYMISCKDSVNIDAVLDWLIKHSKTVN
ncbi:hypothetical protein RHGRI_022465 [Rhododendron griersonianum]|uniref:Uncharacterized protein n=1 Tax=Rhododendron griersonianum TaxID=479676 RepID=A0AAV6J466_9ERIC|nr:hypothetical protein RHGRI_022465 [Rhododendron griersonianum]